MIRVPNIGRWIVILSKIRKKKNVHTNVRIGYTSNGGKNLNTNFGKNILFCFKKKKQNLERTNLEQQILNHQI